MNVSKEGAMSRMAVPDRIRLARANPYAPRANFGLFSRSNRVYCMVNGGFTRGENPSR